MIKILIAEDHRMVRYGLRRLLAEEFPKAKFGEAGTVSETLVLLREQPWSVVVLDLFMPGGGGLEVLREASQCHPQILVLVVSSAPEQELGLRAFQAGASGYLSKQAAAEELVKAVRTVLSGAKYVSPELVQQLAAELAHPSPEVPHKRLSDRELQVLQLLATGKPLKEVAAMLSVSPKTISTFRGRILAKLHLHTDVELVHYALEHRLAERPATTRSAPH